MAAALLLGLFILFALVAGAVVVTQASASAYGQYKEVQARHPEPEESRELKRLRKHKVEIERWIDECRTDPDMPESLKSAYLLEAEQKLVKIMLEIQEKKADEYGEELKEL